MRASAFLSLVGPSLLASTIARANPPASGPAQESVAQPSRFGLEQELTGFDLGGPARGNVYTLAVRGDWAAKDNVNLRLRAPFHYVSLRDGTTHSGPGDVELRLKVRIFSSGHDKVLVFAGVSDTFPTGKGSEMLGGGNLQVAPYITGGYKVGHSIIYATIVDLVAIHTASAASHTDVSDPSADHELRYSLGLIHRVSHGLYLNGALSAATLLVPSDAGHTFLAGGLLAGLTPADWWRVSFGVQLPVPLGGVNRYDYKATLDAYVFF